MERQLAAQGLSPAGSAAEAELVVLNTCTVTSSADQDARAAIRRIHRENPDARIMVTGCYAQRAPAEIASLPGVTWVVGNSHKHEVAEIAAAPFSRGDAPHHSQNFVALETVALSSPAFTLVGDIFAHTELIAAPVFAGESITDRTRPILKVQDGCDNRCSFCIIPSVRGQSRPMKLERVIHQANALVAGSSRIARHAHVPLQSGSDRILRRMHRKYRPWHYAEKIRKIREAMPDAAIGADVMVGFPGETDELFEESRSFIEHLPFTYLHVFTYSSRPGTPSAAMPDQVPVHVARERNHVLRELAAAKNLAFRSKFLGHLLEVITLHTSDSDWTEGLSDNYLKVRIAGRHAANEVLTAQVTEIRPEGLVVVAREKAIAHAS